MTEAARKRPEFRNLNVFKDLTTYRLPWAAKVSILHRISGVLMILMLPFIIWLFAKSISSEISFMQFTAAFEHGIWIFPAFIVKLAVLGLIWAFLHHLCAGIRHIYMELTHKLSKEFGKRSALVVLAVSLSLTVLLGAKLFGLY